MKDNIKHLIEYYGFNPADIKDNKPKTKLPKQVVDDALILYTPTNVDELNMAMINVGMEDHDPNWKNNKHCLNLNCIDVSNIKMFKGLFKDFKKSVFWQYYNNVDISLWNVSSGFDFSEMFSGFSSFDCDLSRWDVSAGEKFDKMFKGCKKFNSNISNWNVMNATTFKEMFRGCEKFNQDLNNWKPIKCKDFSSMFYNCKAFNQDLSSWWEYADFFHDGSLKTLNMFQGCESLEYIPKWYDDEEELFSWLDGKPVSFIK